MINENKLKIIAYKDLKEMLPAGNKLEVLYEKSKDKGIFDESLFPVYDGDIETEALNVFDEIFWGVYYKYIAERDDLRLSQPVVLGNVRCQVLSFREGLIAGNVETKNMWTRYPDHKDNLAQISGNLEVAEVFFIKGKGMKKSTCLSVSGDASIHTLINDSEAEIKAGKLSIQREFSFPFIYATEDRGKHAQKKTDWSRHTNEELKAYFNEAVLEKEYENEYPDMYFKVGTVLSKEYQNYLRTS
ncbi:hypothetical protein [Chitinophaga pinensis]|uniref:Uncharacterized protein n=1 Tax=Chitinophaga pinensis (strain ATCC 43595 / DSM 2588 / LMG 13176 / NBRC 15968 / NCIMB 11800 / UQM 2034) TaxID=485918 RepID=A0A979GTG0_CHIPD|nr:hypothetical protein [Chitinophaga pinensis]ACU63757.1 hypothetical protein Cpin_6353 [Chitinophaga pinensis DSM 2588]